MTHAGQAYGKSRADDCLEVALAELAEALLESQRTLRRLASMCQTLASVELRRRSSLAHSPAAESPRCDRERMCLAMAPSCTQG